MQNCPNDKQIPPDHPQFLKDLPDRTVKEMEFYIANRREFERRIEALLEVAARMDRDLHEVKIREVIDFLKKEGT